MSQSVLLPPPSAQATVLETHLRRMRLPVFLTNYPKLAHEAAANGFTYEQFLLVLAEQELAQRDENMQRRRIRQARFPALKTLDQYDFSLMPQLNRPLILDLHKATTSGRRRTFCWWGKSEPARRTWRRRWGLRGASRAIACGL